jgi:hypothetical protein
MKGGGKIEPPKATAALLSRLGWEDREIHAEWATARRRVAEEDAREVVPGLLNVQGPPVSIDREPDVGLGQVPVPPAQLLEAPATK